MDNFPIVKSFMNKSCKSNKKLQVLMPQFDKALDENQKVRQELKAIRPELTLHLFNASLYDQAATMTESERSFASKAQKSVATCYKKIEHMEHLMNQVELGNILTYTVKCKEDETIREITLLKEEFQEEAKQLDALESRSEVKHLRQLQSLQVKNQKELVVLAREVDNIERQMENKMKKATDYRNRKIINILQTRKFIERLEIKPKVAPVASQSQDNAIDSKRKKRPSMPPKGPILQSALDFLSHFMHIKSNDEKNKEAEEDESEPEEEKEEMGLHSILHRRNSAPSPAKQVRFVASPDMASVRIVERISSMSDDGSVEPAHSEPGDKAEEKASQKSDPAEEEESEYEHDEYEDLPFGEEEYEEIEEEEEYEYTTEEIEDYKSLYAEAEETNLEESSGDEESGMVESGQAEKLPKESEKEEESDASWEEAEDGVELEKMSVEGNAKESEMTNEMGGLGQQNSDKKMKPEVLNVVILPPPPPSKAQIPNTDHMASTSKYSRFKLTASQKSSGDAMDVDEDEDPLQFNHHMHQKMEDEDEDEIPMAQPNPQQIKQPAPGVSPPSSDRGESMLNFSTPNCEFTDDFWLNPSNSANNNVDQFYDL